MTTLIHNYLKIAGIAHRRATALREMIAEDSQQFPNGDQIFCASELATCESIVAAVRSILAVNSRVLDFKPDGKALARTPAALLDTVEDNMRVIAEK